MNLYERTKRIKMIFDAMDGVQASSFQVDLINGFREQCPELNEDLDFCFEVLAGMHKLGYKIMNVNEWQHVGESNAKNEENITMREFYETELKGRDATQMSILAATTKCIGTGHFDFWRKLVNREYRLGYTNKNNMVTDKHCMLAKVYPKDFRRPGIYYIQEKLNGNRCIAYFEDDKWRFLSRSQKPLRVNFDMSAFDKDRVYDGEIMTMGRMGNRDFATTTGAINSKYGDKSQLGYFIYDILDENMPYYKRREELYQYFQKELGPNVFILPTLTRVELHPNLEWNDKLDYWLDYIVDKGGEGIMLRHAYSPYHHSRHSGDRKDYLLKYKQVKTCDLRIVGFNEGKGKYEGMIGSFICETDDGSVRVNVAGMTDDVRMMDFDLAYNEIIEVAYFDVSKAKDSDVYSLQFPRMIRWRPDKTETSMY